MTVNRILTDKDRLALNTTMISMWEICSDVMSRKITDANVQQAFVLDQVLKISKEARPTIPAILSVGCFEDTAFECLKRTGASITGIDPVYGYDLHTFIQNHGIKFDIVFATSVLEHVENDQEFMEDMCHTLKSGGIGILTMDFKDDYKNGDPLPATDVRFYTKKRLQWLSDIVEKCGCILVDNPNWDDKDNFVYQGHQYSFATFVFRKNLDV